MRGVVLTGAIILLSSVHVAAADRVELTILHTNDVHGHVTAWRGWEGDLNGKTVGGFDRLASAVDGVRKEAKNVLLLDAGDAIGDTLIASSTKGKAVVELMNAVGYDAMTIGNHEPDFGMEILRQRIGEARFAVIAANVVQSGGRTLFTKPYLIRQIGGAKVGILGLAYPNTPFTTAKKNVAGYDFRQAQTTASEYVPKLRSEGASVVIVLSHLGLSADRKLAEAVGGIDIIVGGHSHNRMDKPMHAGQTVIVQAGAHLSDLGRLDLTIENGRVTRADGRLITLDNAVISGKAEIAGIIARHKQNTSTAIAQAGVPIVRAQTLASAEPRKRDQESPADSLFADIIRKHTKADIALFPGVGYGVAIPEGPIEREHLRNLVPHESKVIVMTLTGADVRSILNQAIENVFTEDPVKKVGGMIQISGIEFRYTPDSGTTSVRVGGKPLDDGLRYRVATNSMLAEGGHRYAAFTKGTERSEAGSQYEMIEQGLSARKRVVPPPAGRIRSDPK